MSIFNKQFWSNTLELVAVAFVGTFAASLHFTTTPSWGGVASAGIAAGIAALYALVAQLKSVQAVNAAAGKATPTLK